MKHVFMILAVLMCASLFAFAQGGPVPGSVGPHRQGGFYNGKSLSFVDVYEKDLKLISSQVTKIKKIEAKYKTSNEKLSKEVQEKFQDFNKENQKDPDSKAAKNKKSELDKSFKKMGDSMLALETEIKKVLTASQIKKYESMKKNGPGMGGHFMNPGFLDIYGKDLSLTSAQTAKIKNIENKYKISNEKLAKEIRAKSEAFAKENQKNPQSKVAQSKKIEMDKSVKKMRDSMFDSEKEIKKVLTANQIKKYESLKKQHFGPGGPGGLRDPGGFRPAK